MLEPERVEACAARLGSPPLASLCRASSGRATQSIPATGTGRSLFVARAGAAGAGGTLRLFAERVREGTSLVRLGGRYPIEDFGDELLGTPASRRCAIPRPSMMNLDLIVTLDSALAHLAVRLGRLRVWSAPPKVPESALAPGPGTEPLVSLCPLSFSQTDRGQWGPVFERMAVEFDAARAIRLLALRRPKREAIPLVVCFSQTSTRELMESAD